MAVKCASCGYVNHNPDAKACELCQARLKPAEPKPAAALAESGDELAKMAAAATDGESAEPKKKAEARPEKAKEARPEPAAAPQASPVAEAVRKTGPLDVLLFLLSLPVSFPAALIVLLFRKGEFVAVPATVWVGQGLLALVAAAAYAANLAPTAPASSHAVLPVVVGCALVGSLLLVRTGETTAGWASAGVLVGGGCLVTGAVLAMRGGPVFEGHSDAVRALDVSQDGARLVSVGEDGTLREWDVPTRQLRQTIRAHSPVAASVRIDRASRGVLTGGADGLACLWDLSRPETPLLRVQAHQGGVLGVDFVRGADGEGRLLTGGVDGAVRVWSAATGDELASMTLHQGAVIAVAWSPDGARVASGGSDGAVLLWDVPGATVALEHHQGPVLCLAWSPDGATLVSGGEDGAVCVWNLAEPGSPKVMQAPGPVRALALLPDGKRLVTAHDDRALILWHRETARSLGQVELPAVARAVLPLPSGDAVLAATGRTIRTVELSGIAPSP